MGPDQQIRLDSFDVNTEELIAGLLTEAEIPMSYTDDMRRFAKLHGGKKIDPTTLGIPVDIHAPALTGNTIDRKVNISPQNIILSREELSVARLSAAASTIRREGIRTPNVTRIRIQPSSVSGTFVVSGDGNHRIAALRLAGHTDPIPVILTTNR